MDLLKFTYPLCLTKLEMVEFREKIGLKCSFDTKFNNSLEANKAIISTYCNSNDLKDWEYLNISLSIVDYMDKNNMKMHQFDGYNTEETKSVHFQVISNQDVNGVKYTKETIRSVYRSLMQGGRFVIL